MDALIVLLEAISRGLAQGKKVLEEFFINFLVFKDFDGLPKWMSYLINGLIVALLLWTSYPSIRLMFKKSPTLLEKFLKSIFEIVESLLDFCKKLLLERVPIFAGKILSTRFYGNVFIWAAATDGEAILRVTNNPERIRGRLLTPYHKQVTMGMVVVLLAIWSAIGFCVAMTMSFSGNTSLKFSDLSFSQGVAVLIATTFFGLFILALDRTMVSDVSSVGVISPIVFRVIVSVVIASWVSGAYNALLNEKIIKKKLTAQANVKLNELRLAAGIQEQGIRDGILRDRTAAPDCLAIKKNLDDIPSRLKKEGSLDCPKSRSDNCIGVNYRLIESQQRVLQDDFRSKCPARQETAVERQIKLDNAAKLTEIAAEVGNPKYDLAVASDALQEIYLERKVKLFKEGDGWMNSVSIWLSFQPNITYLVLLIIDLLPLIVKFFSRNSYTEKHIEVETERGAKSVVPIRIANRKKSWDPFIIDDMSEKRWHV